MDFRAGFSPTANCGPPLEFVILMRCHLREVGFRFLNVVMKLNCSGSPWLKIRKVGMTRLAVESILYAVCILFDPRTLETPGKPSRLTSSSNFLIMSNDMRSSSPGL